MSQQERYYTISDEVFAKFPEYNRGVVLAYGVTNGDSPEDLISLVRDAEESLRYQLNAETLVDHPRIASWREAYRAFGANPSKFRPSMEAMARRVLKNQELPSINTLVDIGNLVSLRHVAPAGGHAIDVIVQDISLRPAKGNEEFTPLDSDQVETPVPGEIVFVEGDIVLTRRWTWRQARHTLLLPTTTAVEFNIDGLPPVPLAEVEEACQEIIELIEQFCGGTCRFEVLTREHPRLRL